MMRLFMCLEIIDGSVSGQVMAPKNYTNGWREDERSMHIIREYGEFTELVNEEGIGASITKP